MAETPLAVRIATVVFAAEREVARLHGDDKIKPWDEQPEEAKTRLVGIVQLVIGHGRLNAAQVHDIWVTQQQNRGWEWGESLSATRKTDPRIKPLGELIQKEKLRVLIAYDIIRTLSNGIG